MQSKSRVAAEIKKTLKAVHKRTQTKKMMEYEAINEEAAEMRDPTRMYFERWGLLAPPPGKARFEGYISLLSHMGTIPQRCVICNLGVLACWRARNRNRAYSDKVVPFCPKVVPKMSWNLMMVVAMIVVAIRFV
jgi:hypothetical protein